MMIKKIVLGSAQWGSNYGVSNINGKTAYKEMLNILSIAHSKGIRLIDTAPAYGGAEESLSKQNFSGFNFITKTQRFSKCEITKDDIIKLTLAFNKSLDLFGENHLYGILVHHAPDVMVKGGEYICEVLNNFRNKGLVKKIGVSIYDSKNLDSICERLKPDIVQLPINVIDQGFIKDGTLKYLKNKGIEIHARSIFLQGLLLMSPSQIPAYFKPWAHILNVWHLACHNQKFDFLEAALNFVIKIKEIDYCILGFEDSTQLTQCILTLSDKREFNAVNIDSSDIDLVNPTKWRLD